MHLKGSSASDSLLGGALCLALATITAEDRRGRPDPSGRSRTPAGTITDIVPRVVLEQLSLQLGQSIIVENRPGAAQITGANAVAKSEPDGFTLLVASSEAMVEPPNVAMTGYNPSATATTRVVIFYVSKGSRVAPPTVYRASDLGVTETQSSRWQKPGVFPNKRAARRGPIRGALYPRKTPTAGGGRV